MTTEDEIRRTLHPEAYEPMRYEPRPRIPLGCDQQGRHPEAAEQLDDLGLRPPDPEPWWENWLLVAVALLVLVLVFAPLGV